MSNEAEKAKLTPTAWDQNDKAPWKMETCQQQKEQCIHTTKCTNQNPGHAKLRDCLWVSWECRQVAYKQENLCNSLGIIERKEEGFDGATMTDIYDQQREGGIM